MTASHRLGSKKFKVPVDDIKFKLGSSAIKLITFCFNATEKAATHSQIEVIADGTPIDGIAQWIFPDMDDEGTLENRPGIGLKSSWACQFFAIEGELQPEPGSKVRICGAQTSNNLRIWIEDFTESSELVR